MTKLPAEIRSALRTTKRDLTSVEIIADHYLTGRRLTEVQEQHRERIEEADRLLRAGYSRAQTCDFLAEKFGIGKRTGYVLCSEAEELFGDIAKSRKEGLRYLLTEQLREAALRLKPNAAEGIAGDWELWLVCTDRIAKLNNLYDSKGGTTVNVGKVLMPRTVLFSSDPAALELQRQREESEEEAAYEEVE